MFFPRLRRHAKWMFLALAVVFALGFVGFGVGAGGIGFGDILRGRGGGSGAPSVSDAQKRIAKNPNDVKAYRELATALETEGKTQEAIQALQVYVNKRPKDADSLRELAGLYLGQAAAAQQQARVAQIREAYLASGNTANVAITIGGKPLVSDAVANAVSATIGQDLNAALSAAQQAAGSAVSTYKQVVALSPRDPNVQLELANAAAQANDKTTEIAAFKRFLALAPNDPTAPLVRRQLKQLGASPHG